MTYQNEKQCGLSERIVELRTEVTTDMFWAEAGGMKSR